MCVCVCVFVCIRIFRDVENPAIDRTEDFKEPKGHAVGISPWDVVQSVAGAFVFSSNREEAGRVSYFVYVFMFPDCSMT